MILNRWVLGITSAVLLGTTIFAVFNVYKREKPFHVRLKKKKNLRYQLHNVSLRGSTIVAELVHEKTHFTLHLSLINDEIIHFYINDSNYTRYTVQDVIILQPNITEDVTIKQENKHLHLHYKNLEITVNCDDFQTNISRNNEPVLCVNSQKSFVIEPKEPHVGISTDFFFPEAVKAYGLPQHAERLCLTGNNHLYRLFNIDRFAYSTSQPHESLYGTVPVFYAYGTNRTAGVIWLNASETFVEIKHEDGITSTFFSESGAVDFYVLSGPRLKDCVRQNSQLSGVAPLPPLFALGYHQSRYSYMNQDDVLEVSNKFDEHELPLDSLWLDIDYTDDKKYFTWNPKTYPNPQLLLDFLESKERKAVVIIDPHIKVDDDYFVYKQCKKRDFFVKNPDGTNFTAKCWPGNSVWIDFFNPKARKFYSDLHRNFAKSRNLQIWNDMNEPALFETDENAMPKTVVHCGNWKHRDVHNLYGFYQTMATYEGLLHRPNLRPFVLTRSHFVGSQRFAAIWTGDNTASWEHLKISVPMCLTASLTGFSLCGADIGGFVKHPDEELLQRWYQLGAWLPFFRGHSNRNVPRREPYLFDDAVLKTIRDALNQRYMHLLHWYTLFWHHCVTLEPVIRPLIYQYPNDRNVDVDDQFMVGEDILVCPVLESCAEHMDVYLPGGTNEIWYLIESEQKYQGGSTITMVVSMETVPVFYRGGGIIPMVEQSVSSSVFLKDCLITLFIFCNSDGSATGTLYSDDCESLQYLEKEYHYVRFNFENSKISTVQIHQNSFYNHSMVLTAIKLHGYEKSVKKAELLRGTTKTDLNFTSKNAFVEIKDLNINLQQNFIITLSQ